MGELGGRLDCWSGLATAGTSKREIMADTLPPGALEAVVGIGLTLCGSKGAGSRSRSSEGMYDSQEGATPGPVLEAEGGKCRVASVIAGRRPRGSGAAEDLGLTNETGREAEEAARDSAEGGDGSEPSGRAPGRPRTIAP